MKKQTVRVLNKIGFHARPAVRLIETAKKYNCCFTLSKGTKSTNLHSIINLLSLEVKMGDEVMITAEGDDEAGAVKALVDLIESKFGEE